MNRIYTIFLLLSIVTVCSGTTEELVKEYISLIYGDDQVDISEVCHPHPDNWMIRGNKKEEVLSQIDNLPISATDPGVYSGLLGRDLIYTEIRDGKIDTAFNREGIYYIHKQLILQFFYQALLQNEERIEGLVTDISNIDFGGAPKAGYGDMDVYAGVLNSIPIIRSSDPVSDASTHTVTYRLPLTNSGYEIKIRRDDGMWKIDSNEKLVVPLAYFFR